MVAHSCVRSAVDPGSISCASVRGDNTFPTSSPTTSSEQQHGKTRAGALQAWLWGLINAAAARPGLLAIIAVLSSFYAERIARIITSVIQRQFANVGMSALGWTGSIADQNSAGYERIAPITTRHSMPERFPLMNSMPKVSNDTPMHTIDLTTVPTHLAMVMEIIIQQHTPSKLLDHL